MTHDYVLIFTSFLIFVKFDISTTCRIFEWNFLDFRDFSDLKVRVSKIMSNRLSRRSLIGWRKSCPDVK